MSKVSTLLPGGVRGSYDLPSTGYSCHEGPFYIVGSPQRQFGDGKMVLASKELMQSKQHHPTKVHSYENLTVATGRQETGPSSSSWT